VSAPDITRPAGGGPVEALAAAGRWITAVALGGGLGAVVFLIVAGEANDRGYTEITFNHTLGEMIGGEATRARTDQALGVTGDTAGPTGFLWFLVICCALMVVYSLTAHRYLRLHWALKGLVLGVVAWLLVSLVFMPLADREVGDAYSVTVFGAGAGGATPWVFLVASLAFGVMAARAFSLVVGARWWEVKEIEQASAFRGIEGMEDLEPEGPHDARARRGTGGAAPPAGQ